MDYTFKGMTISGVWVYGGLYVDNTGRHYINRTYEDNIVQHEVMEDTVCNSTGIYDNFARAIFFKDVVECEKPYENRITKGNEAMIGVVVYEYGQYYLLFEDGTATDFDKSDSYRRIGNINDKGEEKFKELFESWKESILD